MLPVTLLTGLDEGFRGAVAEDLLAAAGVLVEYDVSSLSAGAVVRIARTAAGVIDREVITMDHPCVSCAIRGSLVQLLTSIATVERYDVAIVNVPAAGDTNAIAKEISAAEELRLDAVITTVDSPTVVADLTGDELVHDRGIPTAAEDGRAIAEMIVRQLESADAVVLSSEDTTVRALTQAINPALLVQTTPAGLLGVQLHVSEAVEPGSIAAARQGEVQTLVWQSTRPFHPERLYDALEDLVAGTARGRGTIWIATQHRSRLSWDSFGTNIAIGVLGPWLADLPADRWSSVGQQHQARSALEWHPEYGDRATYLSFTGPALDLRELRDRLDGCVLRADEAVHPLTDPFAVYLEGSTAA
ncbi:CobW family GTP-binding protein [Kribbella kalugense]|uniref:G3E family GTPase n=1 Tax=Kribbella kalugense TaxID=2512221 RepID=A0A4R7ZKP6_9ACTN|nr:GTP-binding protein [Kribbella kalugense]TDW17776.1 G3E family GTPase [Kribbella kalugense]